MASTFTSASLASLLQDLSIDEDNEQILKHANNVLKQTKTDTSALHAKLVALVKLDRYDDALRILEGKEGGGRLPDAELEHAYCLYKAGRVQDAYDLAQTAEKGSSGEKRRRGLQHVEAQAAYRLEDFVSTIDIYRSLSSFPIQVENEDYDTRVNRSATEAQAVFAGYGSSVERKKTSGEDMEHFETAFNASCQAIARGEYAAGAILLRTAKQLCSALDFTPEELEAELEPLIAQEVYILIKLGKLEEALELSQTSKLRKSSDASVKPIATNNELSATATTNPHLALRLYQSLNPTGSTMTSTKPYNFQAQALHRNLAALSFMVGKLNAAKAVSKEHANKYPGDFSTSAITTVAATQDADLDVKKSSTRKALQALIIESPKDIGLAFTAVQAFVKAKNNNAATQVMLDLLQALEDDPTQRFMPGLVGVIVALYALQGRKEALKKELDKASAYWRSTETPNSALLMAAGRANLASSDLQDQTVAGTIFTSLLASSPSPLAQAGFIASNPNKASPEQLASLTPIETLLKGIRVDSLVSSGVAQPPTKKRSLEEEAAATAKANKSASPKKKRKIRLPKGGIDPTKPPDPERWLPLRDRSTYKPKGKKDKRRLKEATQGGAVASGMDKEGDTEMVGGTVVKKVPPGQVQKKKAGGKKKAKK